MKPTTALTADTICWGALLSFCAWTGVHTSSTDVLLIVAAVMAFGIMYLWKAFNAYFAMKALQREIEDGIGMFIEDAMPMMHELERLDKAYEEARKEDPEGVDKELDEILAEAAKTETFEEFEARLRDPEDDLELPEWARQREDDDE